MAQRSAPVEINTFVGGLISDASPLTFPDNASISEDNFVLNVDGSRNRRLGMDIESGGGEITTSVTATVDLSHTSFKWENAGGDPNKSITVIQFGNEVKFFDLDSTPLTDGLLATFTFSVDTFDKYYSYAVVDGLLVVATGEKDLSIFEYDADTQLVSQTKDSLKIRDLFGVEDIVNGVNLNLGNNITVRPTDQTEEHIYNLRNQSWGVPRVDGNNETTKDPIQAYFDVDSKYPSNSDSVVQSLYPDANDSDNRTIDRFFPKDLRDNPFGTDRAARGHFIIDALERGQSRLDAYADMEDKYSAISITINSLPLDETPGGPSVVAQYAGRIFTAGFSGEVNSGDSKSPRMSSYVLFSRLVEDITDITQCYQDGDPTSKEGPELVDTDGGFIRIDEAYGILDLVSSGNSLMVIASNGVWRIVGNEEGAFRATGYQTHKLTDRGCRGPKSIIQSEGSILYWGDDGIYNITQNQFGDWVVESLVSNRIQRFYDSINTSDKQTVQGYYDSYEKKARWVYSNSTTDLDDTRELVFDTQLGSFYTNTITGSSSSNFPKLVGIYETNPFQLFPVEENVVVEGEQVVVNGEDVSINISTRQSITREVGYICVVETSPSLTYSFCTYSDPTFVDWKSFDGTGVDAPAFMITGYISGGDFQRQKQNQSITTYMRKTEDGFDQDGDGNLIARNTSSCLVQSQWEWTNLESSNRWGKPFQVYRHKRFYMADSASDGFDDGNLVVINKTRLRGKGRVLSIKFETEPLKDLHLYGWSMILGVQTDV